tara:strand:+ start:1825 stop:2979 length:1155 start_codon:yes stop_codon:yes gene_type:complete
MTIKITSLKVHVIQSPLETPFAFSQGWVNKRSATIVEVETNDGITGWGEAFCQGLEPPQISAAVIENSLKDLIINENPLDIERIWFKMYNQTRDFGRKGSVISGISAIDIALWDIAGKYYKKPIYQLLGGAFRKKIKPYATGFYRLNGKDEAERLSDEALMHYENGFDHMKIKLGFGVSDDLKVMESIQKTLSNRNCTFMIDINHAYGVTEALELGYALEEFNLRWYEEPVVPENIQGYAYLRNKLKIPIAGGENEHTLYGFKDLFKLGCIDIAQPDIGSCGGITGAKHISILAQSFGIEVNPHVWGSAVAQSASIHFIASLPATNHSLFTRQPILEYDQSDHPFRQKLLKNPIKMNKGYVIVQESPGLGIEVNKEIINKYKIN